MGLLYSTRWVCWLIYWEFRVVVFKRGAQSHTKLIKAVVSTHKVGKNGKHKTSDVELTAVLLSANLVGAGFSMDKGIPINDLVTVTMAFFDKNGEKGVENKGTSPQNILRPSNGYCSDTQNAGRV